MAPWCLTADGGLVAEWHLKTAKALGLTIPPLLQRAAAASWTAGSTTNGLWKCIAVVTLCCLLAPF